MRDALAAKMSEDGSHAKRNFRIRQFIASDSWLSALGSDRRAFPQLKIEMWGAQFLR